MNICKNCINKHAERSKLFCEMIEKIVDEDFFVDSTPKTLPIWERAPERIGNLLLDEVATIKTKIYKLKNTIDERLLDESDEFLDYIAPLEWVLSEMRKLGL